MKTKFITLLFAGSLISFSISAQTIKENIDKAAKDKNTMDRSAKADVLIHKKIITDKTPTTITPIKVVSETPAKTPVSKTKPKKSKYKSKRKKSSK
jgi:hypothetical protein